MCVLIKKSYSLRNEFKDNSNNTYSIDKARICFKFGRNTEKVINIFDSLSNEGIIKKHLKKHRNSFYDKYHLDIKEYKTYKHFYSYKDDDSTIVLCCSLKSYYDFGCVIYNPNNLNQKSEALLYMCLRILTALSYCVYLDYVEVAMDIEAERDNIIIYKGKCKKYSYIDSITKKNNVKINTSPLLSESVDNNYTEYFGDRKNNAFIRTYNKSSIANTFNKQIVRVEMRIHVDKYDIEGINFPLIFNRKTFNPQKINKNAIKYYNEAILHTNPFIRIKEMINNAEITEYQYDTLLKHLKNSYEEIEINIKIINELIKTYRYQISDEMGVDDGTLFKRIQVLSNYTNTPDNNRPPYQLISTTDTGVEKSPISANIIHRNDTKSTNNKNSEINALNNTNFEIKLANILSSRPPP